MNVDFEKILLLCESTGDSGWIFDLRHRLKNLNRVRRSMRRYLERHTDDRREDLLRQYDKEAATLTRQFLNVKKMFSQLENLTTDERAKLVSNAEKKIEQLYSEKSSDTERRSAKQNKIIDTKIKNLTFFVRLVKDSMKKAEAPETDKNPNTTKPVERDEISPEDMKKMNPSYTNPLTDEQRDEERQKSTEKFREQQREKDEVEAGKTNISHSFSDDLASVLRSYMIKRGANAAEQKRALQPQNSTDGQPIWKWVDEDEGSKPKTTLKITRGPDKVKRLRVVPGYRKGNWVQIKKESYSTNDLIWNTIVESTEYHRWKMPIED